MNIKNITLLFMGCVSFLMQAEKTTSPQEWLKKHATHEQKKMIANLQINNSAADLKTSTFRFVSYNSPEFKMLTHFPPFVQDYLYRKLSSICFEDKMCTKENVSIKIGGLQNTHPNAKAIENFISETYDFIY